MTTTTTAITTPAQNQDLGKFILRAVLAILILVHGFSKLAGGVGFISGMLAQNGLPSVFAYGVYVGEVVAPLMVLFGLWTRAGAAIIAINMVVAVLLAHTGQLFQRGETGGYALELQAMFLFASVAIIALGAGRFSIGGANGKWN